MENNEIYTPVKHIGTLVDELIKELGWEDNFYLGKIDSFWTEVIEEPLSNKAKPFKLNKGTLIINTNSPTLKSEILIRKDMLKDKINNILNLNIINEIVVKIH